MQKQIYIIAFLLLALAFVPVYFWLYPFPVSLTAPCSYEVLLFVLKCGSGWEDFVIGGMSLLYVGLYGGLFFGLALGTFWLSERFPIRALRLSLQTVFLIGVASCAFLKVIHADSFVNSSGTYDFWGASVRFMQAL